MTRRARLLLPALVLLGCSSLPTTRQPPPRPTQRGQALPQQLCVAPIRISVTKDEERKESDLATITASDKVAAELQRWIDASGAFTAVRVANGEPGETALSEAWRHREHLLLEASLNNLSLSFEGHNGWWGPNLALWFLVMVPAWFVATEKYELTFTADWTLRSVDSGAILAEGQRHVRVPGTLREMDRGWQILGFLRPKNDADNWRKIAALFVESARAEAAAAITEDIVTRYVARAREPALSRRMQKTMALVVGASEYRDPQHAPSLPYAAADARVIGETLRRHLDLQDHHVRQLLDRNATKTRVSRALQDLALRTRKGDQLIIYFAGYGTQTAAGRALLTSDADPNGAGVLTLREMAALLQGIEGECIVLLDCSFEGHGRSLRGVDPAAESDARDLARLNRVATTIFAARAGDHLVTPEQVRASLFAFHVARGLSGEADHEHDGVLTPGELFRFVHENVVADAAFFGQQQRPIAAGLERGIALTLTPNKTRKSSTGSSKR